MDELKSKSQKKREADALQQRGVLMVELPVEKLDRLPMTDSLRRAILEAKRLKSFGAVRRQAQLIGKLMRTPGNEALEDAYEQLLAEGRAQTPAFQEAEHWRDKLMHQGSSALTEFIDQYRPDNLQTLRQSIKKAVQSENTPHEARANKILFRLIRSYFP